MIIVINVIIYQIYPYVNKYILLVSANIDKEIKI